MWVVWASVELVEWTNSDGDELQGMLYIPDDLDMTKKHPMMIYYYEKLELNINDEIYALAILTRQKVRFNR